MEKKYIMYRDDESKTIRSLHEAFEKKVPEGKINPFALFLLLITTKHFRCTFSHVIKYALMHAESYRGEYSADIIIFGIFNDKEKLQKKVYEKLWSKK